ncbi:MAG TPA: helix-hairpin-helix domain-containing protein [Myxococcota bacterium]
MRAAEPICRAAFGVACALYALALPRGAPPVGHCARPAEQAVYEGHTVAVRCGDSGAGSVLRGPARRLFGLPFDLNRADAGTLETLPGVGPARALAIVRAREERAFERVEDLLRVPGVGPVTLSRVAPLLSVDPGVGSSSSEPGGLPRRARDGREERW